MPSSDVTFPPVPSELKTLAPYLQRAQELAVKDAVMAYWCTYYVAKQGISSKAHNKDLRPFLFQVMGILEQMKANLDNNDAVKDFDVGAAYIENFALRVFSSADNEDRREQATRSTAKKFLASANFFELLRIFDKPVEPDIEEKIRYAKWKAADLAKAFREGRKPVPGDAKLSPLAATSVLTGLEAPNDPPSSMSGWSPGTSLAPSPAAHSMKSLEQSSNPDMKDSLSPTVIGGGLPEPAQQATANPSQPAFSLQLSQSNVCAPSTPPPQVRVTGFEYDGSITPGMWSTVATPGTEEVHQANPYTERGMSPAITPDNFEGVAGWEPEIQEDTWSTVGNQSMSRQDSWSAVDTPTVATEGTAPQSQPSLIGLELQPDRIPPGVPIKRVHFSPSVVGGLSSGPPSIAASSPLPSPKGYVHSLPTVQEMRHSSDSESGTTHDDLVMRETHDISCKPPSPPSNLSSTRDVPQRVGRSPSPPRQPARGSPSTFPQVPRKKPGFNEQSPTPPALHLPPAHIPPSLIQAPRENHVLRSSPPAELTSTEVARIQKHCRFAISALDYEDVETARKELRRALAMLGD